MLTEIRRKNYFDILDLAIYTSLWILQVFFSIILVIAVVYAFKNLYQTFPDLKEMLKSAVSDGLYIMVLIELIKTVSDYFKYKRVKLTVVLDLTTIFLLREVLISVFLHKMEPLELISLGVFLLILMVMRVLAVKYSPDRVHN